MIHHVTIFGIELTLNPIAFTIFGWNIYWYGIIIACGFGLALLYACLYAKKQYDLNLDKLLDVVIITTPIAILCARAYYLLFDPSGGGIKNFANFFNFKDSGFSGLAIYGGVIGAAVVGVIACLIKKINVFSVLDIASIGFLIGQGIGRWGNFMNQEAFGGPTGSSIWGMTSENVASELGEGVLAHPCFLYESAWCLAGAVLLHFLAKKKKFNGQIALSYCLWYGFGRMIIEGLRTDSLYLWNTSIRVSQALSACLVIASVITMIIVFLRLKRAEKDKKYEAVFGELEEVKITEVSKENENDNDN